MKAEDLAGRVLAGDRRAVARAISMVEDGSPGLPELSEALFSRSGRGYVVGLTGSPGVGKSSLTAELVRAARGRERTVAVLAIDPTSPEIQLADGLALTSGDRLGDAPAEAVWGEGEDPQVLAVLTVTVSHEVFWNGGWIFFWLAVCILGVYKRDRQHTAAEQVRRDASQWNRWLGVRCGARSHPVLPSSSQRKMGRGRPVRAYRQWVSYNA